MVLEAGVVWPSLTAFPPRPAPVEGLLHLLTQVHIHVAVLSANADDYRRVNSKTYPWTPVPESLDEHLSWARAETESRGGKWTKDDERDIAQIHRQISGDRETWKLVRRENPARFPKYLADLDAAILAVPTVKGAIAELVELPAAWCTTLSKALRGLQMNTNWYHRSPWQFPPERELLDHLKVIHDAQDKLAHGVFSVSSKLKRAARMRTRRTEILKDPPPATPFPTSDAPSLWIDLVAGHACIGKAKYPIPPRAAQMLDQIVRARGHPVSGSKLAHPGKPKERIDRIINALPSPVRSRLDSRPGLGYWLRVE